jgi:hypothetical protein
MMMVNTVVRVFDKFLDAENARKELLASDFSSTCVHLSSEDDEAGPVEGNFITGDNARDNKGTGDVFYYLVGTEDTAYHSHYDDVVQRGSFLLTVEANDDAQLMRASSIMDRFGAVDLNKRTRRASS